MKRVHFMGITGSGTSSIAIIAKAFGYEVDGCDNNPNNYYSKTLEEENITVYKGHSTDHLEDIDILAVSPSLLINSKSNDEIIEGNKKNILLTWEEFAGEYLFKDKEVIAIAGTHGKTTTTSLVGHILSDQKVDPTVFIGGIYGPWGRGCRIGKSDYVVCEADEYRNNFSHYKPSIILVNNLEFDHPDFFKSTDEMFMTYDSLIANLCKKKTIIMNSDCKMSMEYLKTRQLKFQEMKINVILFGKREPNALMAYKYIPIKVDANNDGNFQMKLDDSWMTFHTPFKGEFNIYNSAASLVITSLFNLLPLEVNESLKSVGVIKRRIERIGTYKGADIFDDYAHHPTAVENAIRAVQELYPKRKVIAIFEPHNYPRLQTFKTEFIRALSSAEYVFICDVYDKRNQEKYKVELEELLIDITSSKKALVDSITDIENELKELDLGESVILVMGAGNSFKIAYELLQINHDTNKNQNITKGDE